MPVSATTVTQYYTGIFRQAPSAAVSSAYQAMTNDAAALNSMLSAANTQVDPVVRLYQTAFNRLPDNAGFTAWVVPYSTGGITLQAIANGFTTSTEFTTLYPTTMSNAQYVGALYWNILQRQGEDAGINGWVNALNTGALTRAQVLLGFSESGEFKANTNAAVNGFLTNIANTPVADQGKTILYSGSLFDVNGGGYPGNTYILTTGLDVPGHTDGNDTYIGTLSAGAGDTLTTGDSIDGGPGIDTLRVVATGNNAPVFSLLSVEKIDVTATAATGALSGGLWTGVQQISSVNSGSQGVATAKVSATNLQNNVIVGLSGVGVQNTGDDVIDLTFASGKVGTSGVLTIKTATTGSSTVAGDVVVTTAGTDVFKSLVVDATGTTNNVGVAGGNATSVALTSMSFTGTGAVTLGASTNVAFTNVATVDASSNSGGVTVDVSTSTKNISVTGGSGNDSFTVDLAQIVTVNGGAGNDVITLANPTAANLTTSDSISGGDGTADVLQVTAAGAAALAGAAAADLAAITNFERVRTSSDLNGQSFNISKLSGVNYLEIGATTTTGAATVSGFTSGASVAYRAAGDSTVAVNIGITGATNAGSDNDLLNVVLNSDLGATDGNQVLLGVDGINLMTVSAADRSNTDGATSATGAQGYGLVLSNDALVRNVTVTGDRALAYNASTTATGLSTIDASANTSNTVINLSAYTATQGVAISAAAAGSYTYATAKGDIITGGVGNDVIRGDAGNDSMSAGTGVDYLDGGAGTDTMTGGTGNDVFVASAVTNANASTAVVDTITDIDFSGDLLVAGAAAPAAINNQLTVNVDASATVYDAVNTTIAAAVGAGNAGLFNYKGNTYLFVDNGGAGLATTDAIIKVTGYTGTLATTSFGTVATGATINGTMADDALVGTDQADTINSRAGSDTVTGGAGNDTINLTVDGVRDHVILTGTGTIASNTANTDTVNDFFISTTSAAGATEDVLQFGSTWLGVGFNSGAVSTVASGGTISAADDGKIVWVSDAQAGSAYDTAGEISALVNANASTINTEFVIIAGSDNSYVWFYDGGLDGAAAISANDFVLIGVLNGVNSNNLNAANFGAAIA